MERTISDEEKIRKAMAIAQRRNGNHSDGRTAYNTITKRPKEYKLFKRMAMQILICLLIYFLFYAIHNTNDFLSKEITEKANAVLSYDIDFREIYKQGKEWINSVGAGLISTQEVEADEQKNVGDSTQGVEKEAPTQEKTKNNTINTADQMKQDAQTAKKICHFKAPLKGRISSEFRRQRIHLTYCKY